MEYGYSILMGIFSAAILVYAGLMALTKDYKMLPYRATISVKPKNSSFNEIGANILSYLKTEKSYS